MNDINENYFDVKEYNNFRAFLYSPAGDFLGEVELVRPRLSLRTTGFGIIDFQLPEFYFNESPIDDSDPNNNYGDITFNEKINSVLDGYEIEIWFGNLISNDINKFKKMRFKIQTRPRDMADEKTTYSYRGLTNEIELSKVPIINWPGIKVDQYKQISGPFSSDPVVNDASEPVLISLTFLNNPVEDTEFIYRVHTDYQIEEPLRAANTNNPSLMGEEEYLLYEDGGVWKVWVWVPANIATPTDEFGTNVVWSDDSYNYNLYFETEETEIDSTLEFSPYYLKDGLGIEEILKDLINNINPNFIDWSLGTITEAAKEEVRSQLSFSNTDFYEMIVSLADNYQIYIDFDTMNREINIMKLEEFGEDRGLRLEYGKYIKGINQDFTTDNMINYMQGSDADNVGFADVSWTSDNYIEDYSYYLSGAYWNGSELVGTSKWLSTELATEIAKTNYYKNLFNDEVWGSDSLIGIANIKKQLQEKINKKENDLVELEADVELIEGVIEAYENSDETTQNTLNTKAVTAAYSVPEILPSQTYEFSSLGTSIFIDGTSDYYFVESTIRNFTSGPVKSIKIDGVNFNDSFDFAPLIEVKLYNQGVLQASHSFSNNIFGKVISLPNFVTADSFKVEMKVITKSTLYQPIMAGNLSIDKITIYVAENEILVKSWTNYLEYQEQELLDAKSRVANKNNEISKLKYGEGTLFNYDTTNAFDESLIDYNNGNYYGIFQIDKRIKYMSNYTKINFDSLSSDKVKNELRRIRRGSIYQNSNISDSTTLFKAAKEELLNKNYPEVTLNIETINILKASEAYEDWHKAILGEKVFVYVPRIGVEVAAQIQELNIDFESFSMGVKISTTKNYNKSLIKYLSETYKTATKTKREDNFNQNNIVNATEIVNENENTIEDLSSNSSSMSTGYSETDSDLQVNKIELIPTYIDLQTDSLTHDKPVYYETGAGKVKITDGGIYLKDETDKTRIKIDSRKGITANNGVKDTLRIDLDGNARFAGNLIAATGTFDGTITVDSGTSPTIIGKYETGGINYSIYSQNFNIDEDGSASFNGNIAAESGSIGGGTDKWQIGDNTTYSSIYNGPDLFQGITQGIYIGTNGVSISDGTNVNFSVDDTGDLFAQKGIIAGWSLGTEKLYSDTVSLGSLTTLFTDEVERLEQSFNYPEFSSYTNEITIEYNSIDYNGGGGGLYFFNGNGDSTLIVSGVGSGTVTITNATLNGNYMRISTYNSIAIDYIKVSSTTPATGLEINGFGFLTSEGLSFNNFSLRTDGSGNISGWEIGAEIDYTGVWTIGAEYQTRDIVLYNNLYYYCIQAHTSTSSNFPDISTLDKWLLWGPSRNSSTILTTSAKSEVGDLGTYLSSDGLRISEVRSISGDNVTSSSYLGSENIELLRAGQLDSVYKINIDSYTGITFDTTGISPLVDATTIYKNKEISCDGNFSFTGNEFTSVVVEKELRTTKDIYVDHLGEQTNGISKINFGFGGSGDPNSRGYLQYNAVNDKFTFSSTVDFNNSWILIAAMFVTTEPQVTSFSSDFPLSYYNEIVAMADNDVQHGSIMIPVTAQFNSSDEYTIPIGLDPTIGADFKFSSVTSTTFNIEYLGDWSGDSTESIDLIYVYGRR